MNYDFHYTLLQNYTLKIRIYANVNRLTATMFLMWPLFLKKLKHIVKCTVRNTRRVWET